LNAAFQSGFSKLAEGLHVLYAGAFCAMTVAVGLLIAPSLQHLLVEQGRTSQRADRAACSRLSGNAALDGSTHRHNGTLAAISFLFGVGQQAPEFAVRLRQPSLPWLYVSVVLSLVVLLRCCHILRSFSAASVLRGQEANRDVSRHELPAAVFWRVELVSQVPNAEAKRHDRKRHDGCRKGEGRRDGAGHRGDRCDRGGAPQFLAARCIEPDQ
jgi:hypothetical protein